MGVRRVGTSKRVEKQKTNIYWVRGWDIRGGEGGAKGQLVAPKYFWDPPRNSNKFENYTKFEQNGLRNFDVAR